MNQTRLEDLENIVDTLSVLISETECKDLKELLSEQQYEYIQEKEEIETNLREMQAEYEAELRRDWERMRI